MKNLIVGGKDCPISRIALAMDNSSYSLLLAKEWHKLARALDTSGGRIYELEQELLLKRKNTMDIVTDLLFDWVSRKDHMAKFENLLDTLEYQCGWKAMSDNLWNTFLSYMTEDITWAYLDKRSRSKIMECQVEFQAQLTTIKSIQIHSNFNDVEVEEMLQTKLSGSTILKLLRGERITMCNESIPETPAYYIPRVLTSRRRIKPEIFERKCSDIFVVEGINLSDLSGIAGNEFIAKSSNQMKKLTSRFIQLDLPNGFELVAKISMDKPAHHLSFMNGNFYWVKSSGGICLIQEFIHDDQDSIHENDFFAVLQKEFSKNLPVCIADIPGMGKTCLLANLARQRQQQADGKTLVFFIPLSKFLDDSENPCSQIMCQRNACHWIAKYVSQNELGYEIVSKMLRSERHQVEIFFDGYDELPEHKQEFTTKMIKCLTSEVKHVHTAITTSGHKRNQLEQTLQMLSFNIQSFQHNDQVHLFEQFWIKRCGIPFTPNLQRFASFVASKIRNALPSTECDVVGIPLQCSMLADVLANDVQRYSWDSSLPLELSLDINSVCGVYSALMAKRFEICHGDEQVDMIHFHGLAALNSVLPEFFPAPLADKTLVQITDLVKMNSIGLLTVEKNSNPAQFRFLHHSYAEYILANFLVDELESGGSGWENLLDSISSEDLFLEAISPSADDPDAHVGTPECGINGLYTRICNSGKAEALQENWEALATQLSISNMDVVEIKGNLKHYLNRGISEYHRDPLELVLFKWAENSKVQPKLRQLLNALRCLGYYEVAENLKSVYVNPTFKNKSLCFFIDASLQKKKGSCNLKMSKDVNVNNLIRLKDILTSSLYHNFGNLFSLISQHCLAIKSKQSSLFTSIPWSDLVIDAAKCSTLNLVIECCDFVESMQECQLKEMECFKTLNSFVYTPLHRAVRRGDFAIFDYLFKKFGPCVQEMKCLLHCCTHRSLTDSEQVIGEKIQIIQLIAKVSENFLKEKEGEAHNRTPALMWNVHLKLLECILDLGVDIKAVDDNCRTVAHKAARYLSPTDFHTFVEILLKKGEKEIFYMRNKKNQSTPLNVAARYMDLKPETIQLFSDHVGDGCFNIPDFDGDDALFNAVVGLKTRPALQLFVQHGGDPKRLRRDKQSVVHLAATCGNVDAITYFHSLGCSVNARDVRGRTPLHFVFIFGRRNVDAIVRTLLDCKLRADIKDVHGHKAIWYAESEDKIWMLEPSTRVALVKASNKNPILSKLSNAFHF